MKKFWILAAITIFNLALVAVRCWFNQGELSPIASLYDLKVTRGQTYMFLVWNLFLAWVPFLVVLMGQAMLRPGKSSKWSVAAVFSLWLAFFPNAPYIVTDLLHLHHKPPVPFWYDVIMLFSFAWTGLMLGFVSLMHVHKMLKDHFSSRFVINSVVVSSLALCGYGVWLGRFMRWNSWDIVTRPDDLVVAIFHSLTRAPQMYHSLTISAILFVFLSLGYITTLSLVGKEA